MRPEPLLSDPRLWDPRAALVAAQHALEVYQAPAAYGLSVLRNGWSAGTVEAVGAAQAGIAWAPECILVTLRGSSEAGDWLHDLASAVRVGWEPVLPAGVKVGWGFRQQAQGIAPKVLEWIHELAPEGQAPVIVAGHSLGASLCSLVVAYLRAHELTVRVAWSLEAPRTGNAAWARYYDQHLRPLTPTWRVSMTDEDKLSLVPRIPPRRWGARHHGQAVTLTDREALLGEDAWQEHRRRNPVSTWRIVRNARRAIRAHFAGSIVNRLEQHVALAAAAERRAS